MYLSERSLDRACHSTSAMFSLVAAADFSGTSHSRSSKTLGTLYWRREERRVTSPSRVYLFCNRFLPPPFFAPAGPMRCLSLSLFWLRVGNLSFPSTHLTPPTYLPSRRSLRSFPFSFSAACLSLIVSPHSPLGTAVFKWPRMMNMAVSLVPSGRYGNCCHFYLYLRPRCVWFSAVPRMHARMHVLTACTYAFADWLPPRDSPPSLSSPRVWHVSWYLPRGSYLWEFGKEGMDKSRENFGPSLSTHSERFSGFIEGAEKPKSRKFLSLSSIGLWI